VKKAAEVSGFCGEMREKCGRTPAQKIVNFIFDSVKRYFPTFFQPDENFLLFVVLHKYNRLFKLFLLRCLTQAVNVRILRTVVDAFSSAAKEPAGYKKGTTGVLI
jgi:hypothetical protein